MNKVNKKINNDIAIIGISANLPDAQNIEQFWKNISSGKDFRDKVFDRRVDYIKEYIKYTGRDFFSGDYKMIKTINDADCFDYEFFNFPPREAILTDPHQRKFLETAWHAIEDAGYMGDRIKGSNTGIYLAVCPDYDCYGRMVNELDPEAINYISPSNIFPIIGSRISYILDLKGPCLNIDTACSSSLVALYQACQALKSGECDLALAGGVKIFIITPNAGRVSEIDSKSYKTKAFDDNSDGTSWGEGIVCMMLKPLRKAQEDRDNIYAIIKGGAVNQDGKSSNITAPNPKSQAEVIVKAWENASIDPKTISHIETHGTGTPTGDPIEIQGITEAFQKYTNKKQFCAIGSVKSNIGHLATTAGLVGVLKSVLALNHKKIPPTIHFKRPNKKIDFINSPVYVSAELGEWKKSNYPRRCGVSAFGFSGTNCHVVLEEAPQKKEKPRKEVLDVFTVSAKSEDVLKNLIKNYVKFLEENPKINFNDFCYTANTGRDHYDFRVIFIAKDLKELKIDLERYLDGYKGDLKKTKNKKINDIYEKHLAKKDIDWHKYYQGQKLNKISLPTYPFQKKVCWFKADFSKKRKEYSRSLELPLLHNKVAESFDQVIYSTYLDASKDWLLKEHVVGGNIMMPGVGYIEMVLESFFEDKKISNLCLKDINFLFPMVFLEKEIKEIQLVVRKIEDNLYEYYGASRSDYSDKWTKNFEGKACIEDIEKPKNLINIKEIINNFKQNGKVLDKVNDDKLFGYGPRWDSTKKIYLGKNRYLVDVEVNNNYKNEFKDYIFYPAAFDRALNTDIFRDMCKNNNSYLPFQFDKIIIFDKIPTSFYSYVTRKKVSEDILEVDIVFCNKKGVVFAEIKGNRIKKLNENEFKKRNINDDDSFYKTKFILNPIEKNREIKDRKILAIGCDNEKARDIINLLPPGKTIKVNFGTSSKKIDNNNFIIINSPKGFEFLFEKIKKNEIDIILHLGTLNNAGVNNYNELKNAQKKGVLSLFRLIKAIQEKNIKQKLELFLISKNVNQVTGKEKQLHPESSPLFGFGKIIPLEEKNIICRSIDIDEETDEKNIISEIKSPFQTFKVSYRNNERYVEMLDKQNIEEINNIDFKLKDKGVYMITGGGGGVGLEIAGALSDLGKINLALLNRSKFPNRSEWDEILDKNKDKKLIKTIKKIKKIEESGSKVELICCDISSQINLAKNIKELKNKYSKINGIIHCAGLSGGGFIRNKTEDELAKHFNAKIYGTWLLDYLTKDMELDFFINFSSIISVLGFPGQSDYTAASSFQDSFSAYRSKKGKRTMTINWGGWAETGMVLDRRFDDIVKVTRFFKNEEAIILFKKILNIITDNIVINRFEQNQEIDESSKISILLSEKVKPLISSANNKKINDYKIKLIGKESGVYSEIEKNIGQAWCEILGYEKIDIKDTFFELGGDSLSAIKSLNILNKKYKLNLLISDLFENSSIKLLGEKIDKELNKNNNNLVHSKIDIESKNNGGGVPLTAIGDALSKLKNQEIINSNFVVDVNILDLDILKKALKKLYESLGVNINLLSEEHLNLSQKEIEEKIRKEEGRLQKQINNNELGLSILKILNNYKLIFSRDSKAISNEKFKQNLLDFQKIYNLILVGLDFKTKREIKDVYTPYCSYPEYYECLHSIILEKIRLETEGVFFKSLPPALDLFTLPSYYVVKNYYKQKGSMDKLIMDFDKSLGQFDYKITYHKSEEAAIKKYNDKIKKGEKLVLAGLNHYLPTNPAYKSDLFLQDIKSDNTIRRLNLVISQLNFNSPPLIHSTTYNYFGRMSQDDFRGYWINSLTPDSIDKFGKVYGKRSFWLFEFGGLNKIKSHTPKMLVQALGECIKEFYDNKILEGYAGQKYKKAYYGRQVLVLYYKDILNNLNNKKNKLDDIVLMDFGKRMILPYLFLNDLILDILPYHESFYEDTILLSRIIKEIDNISKILLGEVKNKKINYQFKINSLPSKEFKGKKILEDKTKKELLKLVENLINIQDEFLLSVKGKLRDIK